MILLILVSGGLIYVCVGLAIFLHVCFRDDVEQADEDRYLLGVEAFLLAFFWPGVLLVFELGKLCHGKTQDKELR